MVSTRCDKGRGGFVDTLWRWAEDVPGLAAGHGGGQGNSSHSDHKLYQLNYMAPITSSIRSSIHAAASYSILTLKNWKRGLVSFVYVYQVMLGVLARDYTWALADSKVAWTSDPLPLPVGGLPMTFSTRASQ